MRSLKLTIRLFCIIPFATGLIDMIDGTGLLIFGGAPLGSVAADPILNSQIGFWGAIWFGFGFLLWRTSSRLREDADMFRLLCGIVVLSGLARVGAAIAYGLPGPALTGAMAIEVLGGAGLYFWHASALRSVTSKVAA